MIIFKIILFQKQCAENPANRKFLFSGVRTILTPIISYIPRKKKKLLEIDWRMNLHRQWTYDSSELHWPFILKGSSQQFITLHNNPPATPTLYLPTNWYTTICSYTRNKDENYQSEITTVKVNCYNNKEGLQKKNTFSSTQGDKMLIKLYY